MERQYLGDYELLKQIGKGPLGSVYHAQHRFLKRYYAVRILPEELSNDPQFIERFQLEVANLSALHHENIVKVHNISESNGKYFIVTDLVFDTSGQHCNLANFLANIPKRLSEEQIFSILYQVARALDYIHQNKVEGKGVVHRYLNLQSILVGKKEGDSYEIFLNDIGIAPIVGEGALISKSYQLMAEALAISSETDHYTNFEKAGAKLSKLHDTFLQSYPFLSPEQRKMSHGGRVSEKSDVYSFGILAYYLLAGDFPEGFFAPPSAILEYQFNWDRLVFECLSKDPAKRPSSLIDILKNIREKSTAGEHDIDRWKVNQNVSIEKQIKDVAKPVSAPAPKVVNPTIKDIVAEINEEKNFVAKATTPVRKENTIESNISLKSHPQATRMAQSTTSTTALLEEVAVHEKAILKPVLKPAEIEKPQFEPDPSVVFHTETVIAPYKPEEKESVDLQPIPTDMVIVSGGEFYRGSNEGARDEKPYHKISLDSYAIDTHPCTNEQFLRFLEVMGGEKDCNNNDLIRLRESRIKRSAGKLIIESGYNNHPVVSVTWYGAVAYAKWVGKRLPTEAEWEVAARSTKREIAFPTGEEIERDQANYFSSDTTPIMKFPANELGLFDMAGNVYEWCEDWYDYAYYDASQIEPQNPKGPLQGVYRVLRGGCWKSLSDDLRCSHRHRNNPGSINKTYGFRCAADVAAHA
ncbi:MAG: bifunctional serine/threonine-protein kinase/formylglycine-generating enzyme family protein [Rhabdochlamydiaceae bacterium]|nr:bifunctional serine/threonine-protein kinase/formylglycine-generating enzyme family protein [Candidatus Amphrikana amoebophyrae]